MNVGDLMRLCLLGFVIVAVPQGLGNLLPTAGAFAAFELSFR